MTENRRRFRNKKRDDGRQGPTPTMPVTIAKREETRTAAFVQPKILLKKEGELNNTGSGSSGSGSNDVPTAIKTIIINRSETRHNSERSATNAPQAHATSTAASSSVCAVLGSSLSSKDSKSTNGATASTTSGQLDLLQQPQRMLRSYPLQFTNGTFNANARKLFHRSNTDFTVIGILGAQCVGKSTLLNLLTSEHSIEYDYYQHLFTADADECIFANKPKAKAPNVKHVLRPRTEMLQFFITRERHVLLDTAPMLTGSTMKEADHLDLYTLSTVMQMLSVCHVLILAIDEINLEQLRLLHTALRLRPCAPSKSYVRDYLPQVIFVRTRAERHHFEPAYCERLDKQLAQLFEGTNLPIYRGRNESRVINSFLMPQLNGNEATAHHISLPEIVRQFRERVLSTVRVSMCQSNDFNEMLWFDLLTETTRQCSAGSQHFEKIYADIKMRHFDLRSKWNAECNWRKESI